MEGKLLCETIDLDIEDEAEVYASAQKTIKYLADIVKSLENRVLAGETIKGFKLVPGKKTRVITEGGYKYLETILGHDKVFKTIEKPIGITELDALLSKEELASLYAKDVIKFEEGAKKVALVE